MTIAGIGTDLTAVARVEHLLQRFPERFPRRILVDTEHAAWCARGRGAGWLAKRYAAKEALSKALGTGIGGRVAFHDLIIDRVASGAPVATLQGGAAALARELGISAVHVSLSDEGGMAMAFVVLEA